jgi:hypothetical protein
VKTISLKKVSAVAVASLGFGLLSVVPASGAFNALEDEVAILTAIADSSLTPVAVGSTTAVTVPVYVGAPSATNSGKLTATKGFTVTTAVATKPAGATDPTITASIANASTSVFVASGTTTASKSQIELNGAIFETLANGTDGGTLGTAASGGSRIGDVTLTGFDKAGIYTFSITPNGAATDVAATVTVRVGYSLDASNPNRLFPTQGANITSGWAGVATGLATVRLTGFPAGGGTYYVTTSGNAVLNSVTEGDTGNDLSNSITNGTNLAGGATIVADSTTSPSAYEDLQIVLGAVGSATVRVVTYDATTGISTVFASATITISAALSADATVSTSKIYVINTQNNEALSTSTAPTAVAKAVGTDAAGFTVIVNDGYGNPVSAADVVTTISGPGLICGAQGASGNCTPGARVVLSTTAAAGKVYVNLDADGTAGVATLTFSVGSTVLGTKTVTFYGSAAKYTATTQLNATANGTATTDAVTVCAVDAAGIAVPGSTIYAFSGDATVASVETSDATEATAIATSGTIPTSFVATTAVGCVGFDVTGLAQVTKDSVVITFADASALSLATVTTTATVKVGSVQAASVALSTDKTSYAPGEKMTVTLTWKDAYGRGIGAGVGTGTLAAALTPSASLTGDALFATANTSKLGVTSITAYAPLQQGTVTLTGKTGTDATYLATAMRGIELSASVKVVDVNQTSLLTQIDALNAKIVALNALIAKIMKKLGVK